MFERFKGLLSGFAKPSISAATDLPTPAPPKVKNKQQVLPSYLTTAKPNPGSKLAENDRRLATTDILNLRTGNNTRQVIRDYSRASPDLSATVTAYIRTGVTSGYTLVAYNPDGTPNPEATSSAHQFVTRMNVLPDYALGYSDVMSLRSLSETLSLELLRTGAMCGELVLDRSRLPYKIQPIATSQIALYPSSDGRRLVPKQELSGEKIDLDVPTFFMVTLDQDTLEAYAVSPLEPAIQAVIFSADFLNDIRRIVKKAIHPRVTATIDEEKFRKAIPPEMAGDAEQIAQYMNSLVFDLQTKINDLAPEDAMVMFDSIGIEVLDHGNTNLSNEYTVVQDIINSKMATGAKVLPTVLGHSSGTSNVASSEVLVFMKYVEGTIWAKLNEFLSKVFTLSTRLLGHDVYVEFRYNDINLRPELELESFRAMKQSRVLEQLSLGLITDEEAALHLTGHLPPPGAEKLSGTRFFAGKGAAPAGDGYNGETNDGSTLNQNLKSDAPKGAKGRDGGKKAEVLSLV